MTFRGAGARPPPGLEAGAERVCLCVGVTSSVDEGQHGEVGEGATEEAVEDRDEVWENIESMEERMLGETES